MLRCDRDALLCDLAETYHIYDFGSLPLSTVAILACGLRDDSRIKMKLSGDHVPAEILLLAHIADRLGILAWQNTCYASNGKNIPSIPKSLVERLIHPEKDDEPKITAFDTPEEFEAERKRILERGGYV